MITQLTRAGGRRWLAAWFVSCVLALVAGAQLAVPGDGAPNGQLPSKAHASVLTQDPNTQPSTASPAASDAAPSPDRPRSAAQATRPAVKARAETDQPGRPKTLSIPRLGVKLPITSVTVDGTGAMAVPTSPTEVGWYAYGPRPGARGSAVLAGHVDTREYGVGPLVGLQQLHRGDEVIIATDKGAERFRVSTVRSISKRDLDVGEVFNRGGEPLLRIITCGGTFQRSQGAYRDNVVVTALPR